MGDSKVYVGELARDVTERDIEKMFDYYGPIKNIWVARNPPGFAFVEYEDTRDADDAIRGLDGKSLLGSRIRVELSGKGKANRFPRDAGPRGGGNRRPFNPDDRCYECGDRGHYAYDCTKRGSRGGGGGGRGGGGGGDRKRSYSRSRSRSPVRRSYSRSRSRSNGR